VCAWNQCSGGLFWYFCNEVVENSYEVILQSIVADKMLCSYEEARAALEYESGSERGVN